MRIIGLIKLISLSSYNTTLKEQLNGEKRFLKK